ncbi:hypothetical protein J4714_13965 [Staphylococcus epidermidis]|nr:hypothetical protein [Staphylococcus epidermidis]
MRDPLWRYRSIPPCRAAASSAEPASAFGAAGWDSGHRGPLCRANQSTQDP